MVIGPAATSGRQIETVRISDGRRSLTIDLTGGYVREQFPKPLKGREYVLTILRVGPVNDKTTVGNNDACLADFMLYHQQQPFGGRIAPAKLRYDKYRDRIVGHWNGGELGAPETFMTFHLDGTWTWSYRPLMGGEPKNLNGEYRFRGNRLLMRKGETGRWSDMRHKYKTVHIDPEARSNIEGDYAVITINASLGPLVGGEYNNAQF
ncbi:MAG: hypothetical protein R3C68_01225 [Myxococcota bacterium]